MSEGSGSICNYLHRCDRGKVGALLARLVWLRFCKSRFATYKNLKTNKPSFSSNHAVRSCTDNPENFIALAILKVCQAKDLLSSPLTYVVVFYFLRLL